MNLSHSQSLSPTLPMSPLSVSDLNTNVAELLDHALPMLSIRGEAHGVKRYASGHVYFSLKDATASASCVLFKMRANLFERLPRDGELIDVRAKVTLYEPRGDYQLRIDSWQTAGQGALYEAFLQRKALLEREGLLDEARKRSMPHYVRRVGIVTSLQAAVLRDVAISLSRRAPYVQLIVYPSSVQGGAAAAQLSAAVTLASERAEVDVLLVCRGGGSMEDLNAFNDEALARAVAACSMPVISGVGHETDFTLVDFVADLRAPTPTAAAELCATAQATWFERLNALQEGLHHAAHTQVSELAQRLDDLQRRITSASPKNKLNQQANQLSQLTLRLNHSLERRLSKHQHRINTLATSLNALSPQRVLERGYAVVLNTQGLPLYAPASKGDKINIQYAKGVQMAVLGESMMPVLSNA
jgi:exodeoxyribonuclease VII large subunit